MTGMQEKVMKPKLGLLELAKQVGSFFAGLQNDGLFAQWFLPIRRVVLRLPAFQQAVFVLIRRCQMENVYISKIMLPVISVRSVFCSVIVTP